MSNKCDICNEFFSDFNEPYWYCSLACERKAHEVRQTGTLSPSPETKAWAKQRYHFYLKTGGQRWN